MHITNITSVTAAQINSTLGSVTQNSTVFRVLDWLAFKALSPTLWALVAAVINVPSIVLYILEVVELLLSWSEFRTPFYILFLIRAFGDILGNLLEYATAYTGLTDTGRAFFMSLPDVILAALRYILWCCSTVSNLTTFFMSANRFTAMVMPIRHKQIWETSISYIAFITIAAPFLLFAYYLWAESNFIITDNTTFMIATFGTTVPPSQLFTIVSAVCLLAGLFCNVIVVAKLSSRNSNMQSAVSAATTAGGNNDPDYGNQEEWARVERRMVWYTVVTFLVHCLHLVILITSAFSQYWIPQIGVAATTDDIAVIKSAFTLTTRNTMCTVDAFQYAAVPAVLMLLLNKKLRNLIGKRFIAFGKALRKLLPFCKRKNSVGASTTAVVYFSRRRVDDPVLNNNNNGMIGNLAGGLNNNDHSPLPQGDPPASPMVAKITTAPRIN